MISKKSWEETIEFIRSSPEPGHKFIVQASYYNADLQSNISSFRASDEFKETLRLLRNFKIDSSATLVDVGAGNGVAAVSFALEGFKVTALEPDPSETIGAGAIALLKEAYTLDNLTIHQTTGEQIPCPDNSIDIVYARQAMHHANDLNAFIKEAARVLKPGGLYFANRDHVVNDQEQLEQFLEIHPLHKFYGGENAYTLAQYFTAFDQAGFKLVKHFRHLDNIILYDKVISKDYFRNPLRKKIGPLANLKVLQDTYRYWLRWKFKDYQHIPGRCHAFILRKPLD